ncbi:Cas10/Cmr2 second palm domain-containing protein [Campylobacter geochelonis]|uniref:CRISPR-associated protein Cas10/Csm1, subtype III-A/MTUBE n=1 Tax=Campylobacter geochelonis TaxID=1780362 RepID=A0A128EE91_9BACT|nr:hypothetical protein [Campylobacter geochelonis]QKF72046.1 CRISPR/Cas system-associated RAMP protein Cas10, type III [Campylobacter geochelonis]CZE46841.1 CRISPR-associated protein Cas10/Csm1%2C subtype III-A/MTUBE [Campylobacter geochelonis]
MKQYLYGASIGGIQKYIFKTNDLRSIVGASELVKSINEEIKLEEKNIIINAAGNIRLVFDENKLDELKNLVLTFPKRIMQKRFGIHIFQAIIEFDDKINFMSALQELEKALAIQQNKHQIPLDLTPFFVKIEPKSGRGMVIKDSKIVENHDKATLQKLEKYKEIYQEKNLEIPKNGKKKTAIIHADGNSIGTRIGSKIKSPEEYKKFSQNLEKATKEAFKSANKSTYSIREIILGGDDMSIICDANIALEFTRDFIVAFEKNTKKYLEEDITMCAGIAFCNHKFPFHYAINLAEQLCSFAKKNSKAIDKKSPPSSLMFYNTQNSSFDDYELQTIPQELCLQNNEEEIFLNFGPYFLTKQDEFSTIDDFLEVAKMLKTDASPRTRLRDYLTILGQNSYEAKEQLSRIKQILQLKNKFDIDEFEKRLKNLNAKLEFEAPFLMRNNAKFTPFHELISYISVIDEER